MSSSQVSLSRARPRRLASRAPRAAAAFLYASETAFNRHHLSISLSPPSLLVIISFPIHIYNMYLYVKKKFDREMKQRDRENAGKELNTIVYLATSGVCVSYLLAGQNVQTEQTSKRERKKRNHVLFTTHRVSLFYCYYDYHPTRRARGSSRSDHAAIPIDSKRLVPGARLFLFD